LILACGSTTNTFNIPGVNEHAYFLKDLHHALAIRNRILECFERASCHTVSSYDERRRLCRFLIVGGGPTSVEFAAELSDFIDQDVRKWFPEIDHEIVLIEATDHLLGSFDVRLSNYAMKTFKKKRIKILTNTYVKEMKHNEVVLQDGSSIKCGLCVWSTGLAPSPLIASLQWQKEPRSGRVYTNDFLQVLDVQGKETKDSGTDSQNYVVLDGVYAIGDCCVPVSHQLPATAQVAMQQAKYLAKQFNANLIGSDEKNPKSQTAKGKSFLYRHQGSLAYVGGYRALAQVGNYSGSGILAWIFWRSAYFTRLMSLKNKILVPMFWFKSFVFGRDISRF